MSDSIQKSKPRPPTALWFAVFIGEETAAEFRARQDAELFFRVVYSNHAIELVDLRSGEVLGRRRGWLEGERAVTDVRR